MSARPGEELVLRARTSGPVATYFAVLRKYVGKTPQLVRIWKAEALEQEGGFAVVENADGYEVLIFPQISEGGVVEVTLAVAGRAETQTLTKTEIAGWKIVVLGE